MNSVSIMLAIGLLLSTYLIVFMLFLQFKKLVSGINKLNPIPLILYYFSIVFVSVIMLKAGDVLITSFTLNVGKHVTGISMIYALGTVPYVMCMAFMGSIQFVKRKKALLGTDSKK